MSKPNFASIEEANEWMDESVDDPCTDNYRFAFIDDEDAMSKYYQQQCDGCCGSYDADITINGKDALIGCNYGH